jgi:hypothetical protein
MDSPPNALRAQHYEHLIKRRLTDALVALLVIAYALYVLDTLVAIPRMEYAWRIPNHPVINRKPQLPATLVLVNADCRKECHARLLSGQLKEVVLVETHPRFYLAAQPTLSYRVGWSRPGDCPPERVRAVHWSIEPLVKDGFCPLVETVETPTEGVFVVFEAFGVTPDKKVAPFKPRPKYLTDAPSGKIIRFSAVEIQLRTQQQVEVIAVKRQYEAPGLIGLTSRLPNRTTSPPGTAVAPVPRPV